MKEAMFLQNHEILRQLLELASARREEAVVLGWWFNNESDYRLKFLGSDLVGLFKRKHFAAQLDREADLLIERWDAVAERDKGWVLNYKWAASRCEEPMYASLERLLLTTPHHDIKEWILFVPQQMPHPALSAMLHRFLKEGRHDSDPRLLNLVLNAMVTLHPRESQRKTLRRYGPLFKHAKLNTEYNDATRIVERRSGRERRAVPRETTDRRRQHVVQPPLDLDRYDRLTPE
jgi:hypothetical protein